MKVDNIVIVGGGSAGWMTAATLRKAFPKKNIVLVESANIPTVGVGESTLGQINRWMQFIGVDDEQFMPETNASYKMSIKFTDFAKEGVAFHYPFGTSMGGSIDPFRDWHEVRSHYPEMPVTDYVDTFWPNSALFNSNKYTDSFSNLNPNNDVAYHFDAAAFGKWLREYKCPDVLRLETDVMGVTKREDGSIVCLITPEGNIYGDLFIDCTGFKSFLLSKHMEEPFVSYENLLPNNRAWACALPYEDKEKELEPYTNCTAIENGWCWNIPLWSRLGTGYVYSDKFVSDEEALEQFQQYLMSDKMVVPRTWEQIKDLEYRPISMRVGIHERPFVKNVVAIGLAMGFLEPLESNGLLTTHESLFWLIDVLNRGTVTEFDRYLFNDKVRGFFDEFAKFLFIHYAMSERDDTEYWRSVQERSAEFPGFVQAFMDNYTLPTTTGVGFIATGMDYRFINRWRQETEERWAKDNKEWYDGMKRRWREEADKAPTLHDWLKENIHVR